MSERRPSPASKNSGNGRNGRSTRRSVWRRALPPDHDTAELPEPGSAATEPGEPPSVVEAALYRDGVRVPTPATLAQTYRELRDQASVMAWIGLGRPTSDELLSLAAEFDLHPLAVEDAMEAHQRPKLERYGDTLFVVLRAARYLDAPEEVDFAELHVFVGPDFVITVRHGAAPDLSAVRLRMEDSPDLLKLGPEAVLYAILDAVVDGYAPVVEGVQNDIDEIETEVFRGDPEVSRRIYELSREMVEFQRATRPLVGMLHSLIAGFAKYDTDEELQRYLRDVAEPKDANFIQTNVVRVNGRRQVYIPVYRQLGMSTLDVVAYAGEKHGNVKPANFLDIGGGASAEVMANGLEIILGDPDVRSVFVNVFGGITACDEVANGIVQALELLKSKGEDVTKPLVVRLDGNNAELGRKILSDANHPLVERVDTMDGAADKAAELAAAAK